MLYEVITLITEEEALRNCNRPNELLLKLKGIQAASNRMWQDVGMGVGDSGPAATPPPAAPDPDLTGVLV